MKKQKIRMKVGAKPNFGTREKCKAKLDRLTSNFNESVLKRFALKRDEATFADLMRGGDEALRQYKEMLERELPVNSVIPFIADKAQKELREAIDELRLHLKSYQGICTGYLGSGDISLQADYVRYDEETEKVVLTEAGQEAVEEQLYYILTTQRQVDAYNLANKIVEDVKGFNKRIGGVSKEFCKIVESCPCL